MSPFPKKVEYTFKSIIERELQATNPSWDWIHLNLLPHLTFCFTVGKGSGLFSNLELHWLFCYSSFTNIRKLSLFWLAGLKILGA